MFLKIPQALRTAFPQTSPKKDARRPRLTVQALEDREVPSAAEVILVEPMYQDLLGRTSAGDAVAAAQQKLLQKGLSADRLAKTLQQGTEYRTQLVNGA